jgi:hypothetical protein
VNICSAKAIWSNHPARNIASQFYFECIYKNGVTLIMQGDKDNGVNFYSNFIDCILSRQAPIAPAEVGHRSITLSHISNIAMMLEQDLSLTFPEVKNLSNARLISFIYISIL